MCQKGMTLVELMVVLVVASIIGIAVLNMFIVSNRTFMDQNKVIDVQRDGRLVVDYITKTLRGAGLNPLNSPDFEGIREFGLNKITVDRDFDLDGVLDDREVVYFKMRAVGGGKFVLEKGENVVGGSVRWVDLAKNITNFNLAYYDETGGALGWTAPSSDIRSIDVALEFRDEKSKGEVFARTYKTRIDLRNF